MASVYSLKVSTWAGLPKASAFGPRIPLAFPPLNFTCGLELRALKRAVSVCCVFCFLLDGFFPLILFFCALLLTGWYRTEKAAADQRPKKKKRPPKKNDPMSASESEEIQEEAGDAWLPSVVPGSSASWGVKARSYAEISATLEAPGGGNKRRKRKSARSSTKPAPHKLSKSEHRRQQA